MVLHEWHINRLRGMFFGLFVGDALGTTLEFKWRDSYEHITGMVGGGPFNLQPGEWTDDSSMALALGQTLIDYGFSYGDEDGDEKYDRFKIELLKNFTRWYKRGEFSHNGRCFDIGTTTRQALDKFIKSQGTDPRPASTDPFASGNGGIMRLAPAVVWGFHNLPDVYVKNNIPDPIRNFVMNVAHHQSETTHACKECLRIARIMARNLAWLVAGNTWEVVSRYSGASPPERRGDIQSDGFVLHTWQAANWAMTRTGSFRDALLTAVNLGDDADTVGAVTGQLAGALYGYDSIPLEWLEVLAWRDQLDDMFDKLCVRYDGEKSDEVHA